MFLLTGCEQNVSYYTLTLDANGGDGSMGAITLKGEDATALPACTFTKPSYTFIGWSALKGSASAEYAAGSFYRIGNQDTTLYAVWSDHITVSGSPTLRSAFDEGFTNTTSAFTGWNTVSNGTGDWYHPGAVGPATSTDLYPQWLALTVSDTTVTGYGTGSLDHCLILPEGITGIGDAAFDFCDNFTGSLIIPDSVTSIGGATFSDCRGFSSVTMGTTVTNIGYYSFAACGTLTINYSGTKERWNGISKDPGWDTSHTFSVF